jgi:hypothetical protein
MAVVARGRELAILAEIFIFISLVPMAGCCLIVLNQQNRAARMKLFTGNAIWVTTSTAMGGPGAAPHAILVRCLQA